MSRKYLLAIPVLLCLLYLSTYTVDATEYVYLTQFGRRIDVLDGADSSQAGLHFKLPWPIQAVQRLERRLQTFDLPGAELLTRDPMGNVIDKRLTIDAYICWRIAGTEGADLFIRTVGTTEGAELIIGQQVSSELGAAIAELELDDLVNTQSARVDRQREKLRQRLLEGGSQPLKETAIRRYGIDVVDIRLRRTNHPANVRQAIFERIASERNKKAAEYRSEGERLAADIRTSAEREVAEKKADAEGQAIQLRGEAEAEADSIRNASQGADPQFYAMLKKLEDYQRILGDSKSVLLLSTHRELFDLLFNPPTPDGNPRPPAIPATGKEKKGG